MENTYLSVCEERVQACSKLTVADVHNLEFLVLVEYYLAVFSKSCVRRVTSFVCVWLNEM